MPIKFRCQHCKQLLGIAHSKAGSLVDCPTCGRTLRVPNLDGTVDPPPSLGMNLADDGLRRALDELGQIGQEDRPTQGSKPSLPPVGEKPRVTELQPISVVAPVTASSDPRIQELEAKPLPAKSPSWTDPVAQRAVVESPEPNVAELTSGQSDLESSPVGLATGAVAVSVDAPPIQKSTAIALEPLPTLTPIDPPQTSRGIASTPLPANSSEDILAGLAQAGSAKPRPDSPASVGTVKQSRKYSRATVAGVGVGCFLIGLMLGWGVSRWGTRAASQSVQQPTVSIENSNTNAAIDDTHSTPKISGKLTYRNLQGRLEPDAGARVLAIPESFPKDTKLQATGFRTADEEAAHATANQSLRELGGFVATADQEGRFVLELTEGGTFQLIVLSKFQGRKSDTAWPDFAKSKLQSYFDTPTQLVGNRAFHVETIHHKGSGTMVWDHEWEKE